MKRPLTLVRYVELVVLDFGIARLVFEKQGSVRVDVGFDADDSLLQVVESVASEVDAVLQVLQNVLSGSDDVIWRDLGRFREIHGVKLVKQGVHLDHMRHNELNFAIG